MLGLYIYIVIYIAKISYFHPKTDINKFTWMIRIAGSTEKGKHINERDYLNQYGMMSVGEDGSSSMLNSLLYKLSYYRFWDLKMSRGNL